MTVVDRMRALPRTARRVLLGSAIVLFAAAAWAISTMAGGDGARDAQSRAEGNRAGGMAGMDMGPMVMGGDGSVRLSAAQIRTFGVTFGTVDVRPLSHEIRTVGIVAVDETRLVAVTPRFDGYIERLYVNFTGQPVRRGQPLAEVYSPELLAAQEELLLAARLEADVSRTAVPGVPRASSDLLAAARQRLRLRDISEEQIDRILASGRAERTLTLHAPASGTVVEKKVVAGVAIQAGQTLYTIADLSRVWIEAELREADAGLVTPGSAATVELAAFPGRPLHGRVEYIHPTVQDETRTLEARITTANPDGRLRPGMYATVRLSDTTRSALTVATSAVLDTGERTIVFVDLGDGRLAPQDVEIGRVTGGYAEVLAGLEPGQRVVTSAHYLLDSESNLAEVMKSMMGVMGSSDMESMDMRGMETRGKVR